MTGTGRGHPNLEQLLDYWLHDSDAAATAAIDEHLIGCDACGGRLDELIALGDVVRAALRSGRVQAASSPGFAQRLAAAGLKLREYRLPPDGSVNCAVAPDDDLLVVHLQAPLQGVQRLDAEYETTLEPGRLHQMPDVPFDAAAGEVLWLPRTERIRPLPAHQVHIRLTATGPGGTRELARYTLDHRPWAGG